MNSDKQQKVCKFCGSPSVSAYSLFNNQIELCDNCKIIFDEASKLHTQNTITQREVKRQEKIDERKAELDRVAKMRADLREEVDEKYIRQYASLVEFDKSPVQICEELDRYVVGQNDAKKKIAVAVRRHYRRIALRIKERYNELNDKELEITANNIPKENILLIGPTGSGKTYTCRVLSEIVSVPFWAASMTSFTEDGYVGDSVENLIASLLRESGYYNELAECGMMFMDEIDKKAMKNAGNPSISRDVSGEGVQSAILDMIDTHGSVMNVGMTLGNRRNSQRYTEKFNTRDVLFFMGGAFPGLLDIVKKRVAGRKSIGFGNSKMFNSIDQQKADNDILQQVLPEDIVEYGFLPELVGRFGLVTVLNPLTKDDMKHILLDTENAIIKQQQILAQLEDFQLEFTEEALDAIIDKAITSGMGARRLKSIVTNTTEDIFYNLSGAGNNKNVKVLAETVGTPSVYEVTTC